MGDDGRRERVVYTSRGPAGPVFVEAQVVEDAGRSMEAILADAPVGSIVVWKSLDATEGHAFATLPSIKLGADEFAAHGLSEDRNRFTRSELAARLQAAVAPDRQGPPDKRVFIAVVEIVKPF